MEFGRIDPVGAARKAVARAFAQSLLQDVIPLLGAFDEREQIHVLAFETERLLLGHHDYLEKMADAYRKVAEETIACSLPKVLIVSDGKAKNAPLSV